MRILRLGACACLLWLPPAGAAPATIVVGFSDLQPGGGWGEWKPLAFKQVARQTDYELIKDENVTVVRARAHASASGLTHAADVDLKQYPLLRWRWKAENLIAGADPRKKSGDDYPARIYVTFKYDPQRAGLAQRAKYAAAKLAHGEYPPHAAINYVWDGKTPLGSMLKNAYSERVMMIVTESGGANLGRWVSAERNLYEDYKRAFGEEPPPVSGVAIMTDADNTGQAASAYYGDISFSQP